MVTVEVFERLLHSRRDDQMISSKQVMDRLGYKDRGSFWELVHSQSIPHIRLNARVIKFPVAALNDWLRRRSSSVA